PYTQSPVRRSHQRIGASRKRKGRPRVWPHSKKKKKEQPSATRICHTKEGTRPTTHGAEPTEHPGPPSRHRIAAIAITNESKLPASARQSSIPRDTPSRPRKRRRPSKPKGVTERPQPAPQRCCIIPEMKKQKHQGQTSKSNRDNPNGSSTQPYTTATPHILPYVCRDTLRTTNFKHTPPARNHPADKQTPPQYKAEKPDATAKPSYTYPAAPTRQPELH
ncbi:hypothetical protein CRENBAI_007891, partial [Crenichthys baileyi]